VADIDDSHLLDDEAWAQGEYFWRELVDEILASIGQAGEWPSWEPKFYGDGITPVHRDGQSICDGRSSRLDRSFSIQQFASTSGTPEISARVKDYVAGIEDFPDIHWGEGANAWFEQVPPQERVPRSTLVIVLEYSDATAALARSLLTVWLTPETTVAEMQAFIDATLGVSS
jgi:hypothetical protein